MVEDTAISQMNELFGKRHDKLPPFDMGIKEFKRLVRSNPMFSKSQQNQAIKAYKERVYVRVDDIKAKINESKQNTK